MRKIIIALVSIVVLGCAKKLTFQELNQNYFKQSKDGLSFVLNNQYVDYLPESTVLIFYKENFIDVYDDYEGVSEEELIKELKELNKKYHKKYVHVYDTYNEAVYGEVVYEVEDGELYSTLVNRSLINGDYMTFKQRFIKDDSEYEYWQMLEDVYNVGDFQHQIVYTDEVLKEIDDRVANTNRLISDKKDALVLVPNFYYDCLECEKSIITIYYNEMYLGNIYFKDNVYTAQLKMDFTDPFNEKHLSMFGGYYDDQTKVYYAAIDGLVYEIVVVGQKDPVGMVRVYNPEIYGFEELEEMNPKVQEVYKLCLENQEDYTYIEEEE